MTLIYKQRIFPLVLCFLFSDSQIVQNDCFMSAGLAWYIYISFCTHIGFVASGHLQQLFSKWSRNFGRFIKENEVLRALCWNKHFSKLSKLLSSCIAQSHNKTVDYGPLDQCCRQTWIFCIKSNAIPWDEKWGHCWLEKNPQFFYENFKYNNVELLQDQKTCLLANAQ